MVMVYQLYALTLPQEISLRITEYRRALFSQGKNSSTLIFEPMIPLTFCEEPLATEQPGFIEIPLQLWKVGTHACEQGDSSYLPVTPPIDLLSTVRTQQVLFTLSPGIYLGTELEEVPSIGIELSFSELWLTTYRIEVADPRHWWTHVVYTQLGQLHLRRGRRT